MKKMTMVFASLAFAVVVAVPQTMSATPETQPVTIENCQVNERLDEVGGENFRLEARELSLRKTSKSATSKDNQKNAKARKAKKAKKVKVRGEVCILLTIALSIFGFFAILPVVRAKYDGREPMDLGEAYDRGIEQQNKRQEEERRHKNQQKE